MRIKITIEEISKTFNTPPPEGAQVLNSHPPEKDANHQPVKANDSLAGLERNYQSAFTSICQHTVGEIYLPRIVSSLPEYICTTRDAGNALVKSSHS